MKTILYIATKYIFLKDKTNAINILSIITMVAIACGAAGLVIILSTFNGFEELSKSLNESIQSDLTISAKKGKRFTYTDAQYQKLLSNKSIDQVSQTLEEKVYVKYDESETIAILRGVDEHYFQTNELKDYLIYGDTILENEEFTYGMIGVGIANRLNLDPNNPFEQMQIYFPQVNSNGFMAQDNFEIGYVKIGSIFSIYQEYDEKYIIAPLAMVRYLQGSDETTVSTLEVKLKDSDEHRVKKDIQSIFGDHITVMNKMELNSSFYKITRVEKLMVMLIMTFVLIILSINFIGSLTMHRIDKETEIKTLRFLGINRKNISKIYLSIGVLQGILGAIIGVLLGLFVCFIQITFGIVKLPGSGTFVIQSYPVNVQSSDILMIFFIILFITTIASIWPAIKAGKE